MSGFVPFFEQNIQGLFKDFQGNISYFARTPFSAKKSLESMSFLFFHNMSNFILKVFLYLLLFLIKLALKFKDFPALTSVFKDFQGIEI